jgi:cell division protein FtsB
MAGGAPVRRWLPMAIVFVGAALVANALIGERGLVERWRVQREHDALARSVAALRHENRRMAEEVRRLMHDPKAIEDAAREDLGLARADEVVFVVRDAPSPSKGGPQPSAR